MARVARSHRQLALFVIAVFLPCIVLVALALRLLAQERELADKRLADFRRAAARDVGRDLRERLDTIAAAERDAVASGRYASPATALVARLVAGTAMLPWRDDPHAREFNALAGRGPYARAIREGERAELVQRRFADAARHYAEARRIARSPLERAWADLLLARARQAAGTLPLEQAFTPVAMLDARLRDDEGVPLAAYAFARLAPLDRRPAALRDAFARLSAALAVSRWTSPAACHAVTAVAASGHALTRQRCIEMDRAETLANAVDVAPPRPAGRAPRLAWRVYAAPAESAHVAPWIASATTDSAGNGLLVVLRLDSVVSGLPALGTVGGAIQLAEQPGSVSLADIAGLWLTGVGAPGNGSPARAFYLVSVAFALFLGLFGAWLLWRDVRREVATAELRSQFVSGVTHELKTPLTAIRMFAETLRDRAGVSERQRREYLDTLVGEAERLTRLLNNVLDFSRMERGERRYRLQPADLRASVDAALRAMRHPLQQQGFTILVEDDGSALRAHCDRDAIEQALLNLMSNAVKYSGDSRDLRVTLERDGAFAVVSVTDFGVGIPAHEHARIFEKFHRVPAPINESVTGTGLGLTLAQHIAQAHGGRITVTSTPGQGSTFRLWVPLDDALAPVAPDAAPPPLSAQPLAVR